MTFFDQYLSDFQQVSTATKIAVSVIMAQVADETGTGGSYAFNTENNWAGVSAGGGVNSFPNKAAGLNAYIAALNQTLYDPVRAASGNIAQAKALGLSPWAAAHYDADDYFAAGQPADGTWTPPNPGIDLINIINENNLGQYDGASGSGSPSSSSTAPAGPLPNPKDPLQLLSGIFFGQPPTAEPAFSGHYSGKVVSSTSSSVVVTVDGFDASGQSTFTCSYETRPGASPATPPAGTACLVAFPVNGNGVVNDPWVVAFTGWP